MGCRMGCNVLWSTMVQWLAEALESRQDSDLADISVYEGDNIQNTRIRICAKWELRKNGNTIIIVDKDSRCSYIFNTPLNYCIVVIRIIYKHVY